jgi:thioredoxin reductase (NADPH)
MYDCIIIGAGPAGLSAAIYASRYKMKILVLSDILGGQISESREVENYPGTIKATGLEMMEEWKKHALAFGAEIKMSHVKEIKSEGKIFKVSAGNENYEAKAILLATGARHKDLEVPGEKELAGRGVSYCPTCDGFFFTGKTVAIVGGGNSAFRGAQLMVQYASKVYLIHRREDFRAEPVLVDIVKKEPKVEMVLNKTIKEIVGKEKVEKVILNDGKELLVDGVFIEIGKLPNVELAEELGVKLDREHIIVNTDQSTNVPGVFAAGDVTIASNMFRQVLTAAAEGAISSQSIFEYIRKHHGSKP